MKTLLPFLVLVVLLIFAALAWAGAAPNYTLAPEVIASGGQASVSANYSFVATVGQPLIGAGYSASYLVCAGLWCEMVSENKICLPLVLKSS